MWVFHRRYLLTLDKEEMCASPKIRVCVCVCVYSQCYESQVVNGGLYEEGLQPVRIIFI